MSNGKLIKRAEQAVIRAHNNYGEAFRLLKYVPTATGGIYRQRRKQYEDPIELKGCVSREPFTEAMTAIGEGSERVAHITMPVAFGRDVFGADADPYTMITTSDLVVIDNRVWRIIQCALTARVGDKPLIFDIDLREKVGASEEAYHG